MKKIALPLLVLIAIAIALAIYKPWVTSPSVSPDKISLRLPIPVVDASFAPYYLAVDEGFYKEAGLDVKIEPGTPDLNPVKMVSQKIDQFGVLGGPELLLSGRNKGADIAGIMLLHKNSDFVVLLTLKKSGLDTLDKLQGKKVGMFYGHISTDVLHMLFKKQAIKVNEVDVGFDYGPLISGSLDAEWAFRTTAGITLPAKGIEINMISPATYGIHTDGHVLIANGDIIRNSPDLVERFVKATRKGIELSLSNPARAIESVRARNKELQIGVIEKQLEIYSAAIKRNNQIGAFSDESMLTAKEQMKSIGLLPEGFDIAPAYTNRFIQQ